ncbi:MAG: hypothetical protein ACP5T4_00085 [Candidatus Micrarchaeia archaeon]
MEISEAIAVVLRSLGKNPEEIKELGVVYESKELSRLTNPDGSLGGLADKNSSIKGTFTDPYTIVMGSTLLNCKLERTVAVRAKAESLISNTSVICNATLYKTKTSRSIITGRGRVRVNVSFSEIDRSEITGGDIASCRRIEGCTVSGNSKLIGGEFVGQTLRSVIAVSNQQPEKIFKSTEGPKPRELQVKG